MAERAIALIGNRPTRWRRSRRAVVCGLVQLMLGGLLPFRATAALAGVHGPPRVNQWTKFHYDLANTGFNPHEKILSPSSVGDLVVKWAFPAGDLVVSAPVIVNDTVFTANSVGDVYAIEADTGDQLWKHSVGGTPWDLSFSRGTLFVGTNVGDQLYALDAATGHVRWSFRDAFPVDGPLAVGKSVYVATGGGELYALRAADGTQRWKATFLGEPFNNLAYSAGMVYVGDDFGCPRAFDARTGALRWTSCVGAVPGSPAVAGGRVFLGSRDEHIYAVDAATGDLLWSGPLGDDSHSSAAAAYGMVFIGAIDGKVYAFPQSCTTPCSPIWTYQTAGDIVGESAVVANGVVYIGSHDNTTYALDARTGVKLWSYSTIGFGWFTDAPAVLDGVLYAGSYDHNLYAFSLP